MSKIYDALLRAELDRTAASGSRSDSSSPEEVLTRDILASLNQNSSVATAVPAHDSWKTAVEPMPSVVIPEAIPVWNPAVQQHPGVGEDADETDARPVAVMKACPHCSLPYGVRAERKGFYQKHIASFFGYFPWSCKACRNSFYSKDRGAPAHDDLGQG